MSQEIIFTTLPHKKIEIDGKKFLQLSVFTSIKLETDKDTKLSTYANILEWSEIIKNSNFKFKLSNGKELDAVLKREQIDTELYKTIFHKNIKVDDFKEEDFSTKKFFSVPILHVQDFILDTYLQTAILNPKKLVSADHFIDDKKFAAVSGLQLNKTEIDKSEKDKSATVIVPAKKLMLKEKDVSKSVVKDLKKNKFIRFSPTMNPKKDFVQLRQFHRIDTLFSKRPTFKINKPTFEYHDIMAVLNSYPQIMRKVGLILDFLIEYDTSIPSKGSIKIVPDALNLDETKAVVSIPATAYEITSKGFYVSDKPDSIFKQGFVKINTDQFSVVQIDADGAALKTVNMAETKIQQVAKFYELRSGMRLEQKKKVKKKKGKFTAVPKMNLVSEIQTVEPPEDEGLPYMRTAGIAIAKNGMAEYLFKSSKLNLSLQTNFKKAQVKDISVKKDFVFEGTPLMTQLRIKEPEVVLYSNEIIQGYRMDIAYKEDANKWYSLHQKQDSYSWYDESNTAHPIDNIDADEGFIQLAVSQDPDDEDEVFVSETMARWEGWSLSVHKPGYAINEANDYKPKAGEIQKDFVHKSKAAENKKYAFDADMEFRINAKSKAVKGSLPKLRFGKDYHIRIRTVDVAGNSVALDAQSESPELTKRKNIRYMRYEPLLSPITLAGNELKDGEFLEHMVIRSNFDQTATQYEDSHILNGKPLDEFSQRYLLPPKNSQLMAETHAKLEKAFEANPAATQAVYKLITDHEGLYQQKEKNKERIYKPSEVEIMYLPDPMAAGVSLFVAEGYAHTHTQEFTAKMFSFFSNSEINPNNTNAEIPADWYKAGVIRIRLEEGDSATKWDSNKRIFTVFLPKGQRTRIKISTFWREKDFKELAALWNIIKQKSPANKAELEQLAKAGQNWMLSPAREMELVHAVQQPVDKPKIDTILSDKEYNETIATLHTKFDIHGESTEKVSYHAKWTDPVDDGISVNIKEKDHSDIIANIPVYYHDDKITLGTVPENVKIIKPNIRFTQRSKDQFKINPQPGASKMNQLYKPQISLLNTFKKGKKVSNLSLVNRLQLDILEPKLNLILNVNLRLMPLAHHFGDTKHHWVDYRIVAASRYREYFDKLLATDKDLKTTRGSDWVNKVNILSSAQPKPPEIDYIIPTFEWKKSKSSTSLTHQRLGGGLRVFIKRPWYSSGIDEKLAVIIPASKGKSYSGLYTHWGVDPILISKKPSGVSPLENDFRYGPFIDKNLTYPDQDGVKATAIAYPVHFDEERQLWYSDIAINTGNMYFPFIKLALARHQEHSVRKDNTDVCLSSVVSSKMMQLMPDRKSSIRYISGKKNHIKVQIEGSIYNERTVLENSSSIRISFFDQDNSQPLNVVIDPEKRQSILDESSVEIAISSRNNVTNNKFKVIKEIQLPQKYATKAYKILIEELEHGPNKMRLDKLYQSRLGKSSETDRLIYADVFVVNE